MNYALHAKAIVDGLSKNYANLQAVVEICQFFVSKLSTVIDSTNQILIPGAGIMERRHQWNVYRLPRVPLASLTESRSSLAESYFQTSLGACSQASSLWWRCQFLLISIAFGEDRCLRFFSEERAWRKERKRGYTFACFLFTATPRHKRLARKNNSKDWTTDWTCIFFKRNSWRLF